MIIHTSDHSSRISTLPTDNLRQDFLVSALFRPGEANFHWWETDRTVLGGIVPSESVVFLPNPPELKSEYFLERREAGLLNLGGPGRIQVDGTEYAMDALDGIYLGRGVKSVSLASESSGNPARYWMISYPAHVAHPTRHIAHKDLKGDRLGSREAANERTIFKYFHPGAFPTCQLVMGFTRLEPGNVWNTMPTHMHLRRSEVYLYFNVRPGHAVFHFLGAVDSTRHVIAHDFEAVLCPPWSVHFGVGTSNYTFVWAMGGENQMFADMDAVPITDLR